MTKIAENSWARVLDFLPKQAAEFIKNLLIENPTNVFTTKVRLTKHGDYHRRPVAGFHKITINRCGNTYQFLITLLHELAHARAYQDYGVKIRPHGQEWRITFSAFLHRSLAADCFPENLVPVVRRFAFYPTATTSDFLEKALRPYDTLDKRPLVSELSLDTFFCLRSGRILQKGESLGKRFLCKSSDGTRYKISALARVHATYKYNHGAFELITDYQAITQELTDAFEEYDAYWGYVEIPAES